MKYPEDRVRLPWAAALAFHAAPGQPSPPTCTQHRPVLGGREARGTELPGLRVPGLSLGRPVFGSVADLGQRELRGWDPQPEESPCMVCQPVRDGSQLRRTHHHGGRVLPVTRTVRHPRGRM